MKGFIDYRKALSREGIERGFQWINGSFVEDIERSQSRPPSDIDVVTFFHIPPGDTQMSLVDKSPTLFNMDEDFYREDRKRRYGVHAFMVCLDGSPTTLVQSSRLWYRTWSMNANLDLKGYIHVPLDPLDDMTGSDVLRSMERTVLKGM